MLRNSTEVPKNGPVNVALYLRVSTDKQAKKEDGSLDTQLDRLRSFVEYKRSSGLEWVVTERFVEGERDGKRRGLSAKDTDRPALQRMLEMARARLIDVVVITKIDRISRSVIDFLLLVEELERCGVRIVSLHENIDLTTPAGRFQTTMVIGLAQHEREVISARTKEKAAWRAEKGLPIGPPPLGYKMQDKMFVIDEPYAVHVRAADALYLEHQSTDVVLHEFHRRGYRTPAGRNYNSGMICRLLRNPVYAAKLHYEGHVYDAQWQPIRSWETHQLIQKTMDRNHAHNRSPRRQSKQYVYLLQGLIRCGACGHKMTPAPGQGRSGVYYPYYCCSGAAKSRGHECAIRFVPAQAADHAVLEYMKRLQLKPEIVEAFASRANESTSDTLRKLHGDFERVGERLAAVRTKITHMVDAIADGGRDALASVKDRLRLLEAERAELESSEAKLKAEIEAERTQQVIAQDQIAALKLFEELVRRNDDKPDRVKSLIPRFIDYIVWRSKEKGEGEIEVALFPTPVARTADGCEPDGRGFLGSSSGTGAKAS